MPWPEKTPDWGYGAIGDDVISRRDLRALEAQEQEEEEQEQGTMAGTPARGPRRQEYYQAAQELMKAEEGFPGAADDEEEADELLVEAGEEEEEEEEEEQRGGDADQAVVAAERRYRARCRLLTTGLAFAAALAASLALIGAGIHSATDPSTVLNPSTLEEKDPEHGYPFPPPPPPSGEGPIHPPSIPAPSKGKGGESAAGSGKGKGAAGKKGSGVRARRELRQPEIRRAENGLLDTTLRILPTRVTDGPVSFSSRAYEGTVPGPTLMLKPGDTMRLLQVNELGPETLAAADVVPHTLHWPNTTTIHTHGLHMDPGGIADNIYRVLSSNARAESVYPLRADHQPGTFYYHPHFHGSSTLQMAGGMAGALIVEDDPATLPPELRDARDVLCMLQHVNVASGTFRNYRYSADEVYHSGLRPDVRYNYADAPGNYFIVNGQYLPQISLRPQEVVRLRMINGGHNDYLHMRLPGCQLYEIAADGVYYSEPRPIESVLLVVGSRKDLLVQCALPGEYPLEAVKDPNTVASYMGAGTDFYEGTLLYLNVLPNDAADDDDATVTTAATSLEDEEDNNDAPVLSLPDEYPTTVPSWLPAPDPEFMYQFLDTRGEALADEGAQHFDYVFTTGGKRLRGDGQTYSLFGVNGHLSDTMGVQRRVKLGALEEWAISEAHAPGAGAVNHPFHIHVNHFQIVDLSHGEGLDFRVGDWRDSISVPLLPNGGGYVTVRWRADDYVGKSLAHCHILAHVDTGMSLTFEVYDDEKEEEDMAPVMVGHGGMRF